MKITRLRFKNYRGIEELDTVVGPAGLIVRGRNGAGKTSVLKALRAALASRDIGEDAIRTGAKACELLIDIDHYTVRRTITAASSKVTVTSAAGDEKKKPGAWLAEVLGSSPLDPLDLLLADAKKRRSLILAALPVKVTREMVDRWIPSQEPRPSDLDAILELHGLEARAEIHRIFFERRAAANVVVKTKKGDVERLEAALEPLQAQASVTALPIADAEAAAERARIARADLQNAAKRIADQDARFDTTRKRIADLLAQAAQHRSTAPSRPSAQEIDGAYTSADLAAREVIRLEAELAAAREGATRAKEALDELRRSADLHERADATAKACESQAKDLDLTIQQASEAAPSADQIAKAEALHAAAQTAIAAARAADRLRQHARELDATRDVLKRDEARADALTEIVDRLAKDAPAELIAASDGIPGLGIDGDSITLDGISIDALSGREQMRLAVEIARRANAKTKIIVMDGLERIQPNLLEGFVADVTRDGYQLFATRVADGEIVLEAIQSEKAEAAE